MPDANNSSRYHENFRGRKRKPTLQRMQALLQRSSAKPSFDDSDQALAAPKREAGPAIMIGNSTPKQETNLHSGTTLRMVLHKILEGYDAFARFLTHTFVKYFTGE